MVIRLPREARSAAPLCPRRTAPAIIGAAFYKQRRVLTRGVTRQVVAVEALAKLVRTREPGQTMVSYNPITGACSHVRENHIFMPPCLFVWIITNEIYREP
jgi:hypothetical protein